MRYYSFQQGRVVALPFSTTRENEIMPPTTPAHLPAKAMRAKGATGALHKTLNFKQKLTVYNWVQAHKDKLLQERPNHAVVAEQVSRELDLDVSEDSFRGICRQADVVWHARVDRNGSKYSRKHIRNYNQIRTEMVVMRQQIEALRAALAEFTQSVGEKCPPTISKDNWPTYTPDEEPES
jgi:hypothetical protein